MFTGVGVSGQVSPGRYTPQQVHPLEGTTPGRYTPHWAGSPPQAGTPPAGTTPGNACWDMVNKWAVHILLECILVGELILHQKRKIP